jgi:hypothetical protein
MRFFQIPHWWFCIAYCMMVWGPVFGYLVQPSGAVASVCTVLLATVLGIVSTELLMRVDPVWRWIRTGHWRRMDAE